MKLITWNCQGAFRKKAGIILNHQPDILVVQECEHPDKLVFDSAIRQPNGFHWYGDSAHKGIAICSYTDYKIELLPVFRPEFRYVLPFSVRAGYNTDRRETSANKRGAILNQFVSVVLVSVGEQHRPKGK